MSTTNATAPTDPELEHLAHEHVHRTAGAVEQGGVCRGHWLRVGPAAVSVVPAHRYPRARDVAATRPRRIPRRRHHRRWPAGQDVPAARRRAGGHPLRAGRGAGRLGRPRRPVLAGREPRRRRGGARLRPRLRRRDVRPRARPGRRPRRAGGRRRRAAPQPGRAGLRPGQAGDAPAPHRASASPCPRWAQVGDRGRRCRPSATRSAGRWWSRPPAAATTARACASSRPPTRPPTGWRPSPVTRRPGRACSPAACWPRSGWSSSASSRC